MVSGRAMTAVHTARTIKTLAMTGFVHARLAMALSADGIKRFLLAGI